MEVAHVDQEIDQGITEAELLYQRAISLGEQTLGGDHSQTGATRALYAQLLQEQARAQQV